MQKNHIAGWNRYNITFDTGEGFFRTYQRYAPNVLECAKQGHKAISREYPRMRILKIKPYVEPKPEKPTNGNPFPVGTILEYSWGYDQTNVDFFQVVKTTPKTVMIRELQDKVTERGFQSMSGLTVPVRDQFKPRSKEQRKRVQFYSYLGHSYHYVKMPHGQGTLWDGKPQSCSWYC